MVSGLVAVFVAFLTGNTVYSAVRWNRFCRDLDRDICWFDTYGPWPGQGSADEGEEHAWDFYRTACREIEAMPERETKLLEHVYQERETKVDLEAVSGLVESRWKITELLQRGAQCYSSTYRSNPSRGRSDENHPWLRNMRTGLRLLFAAALLSQEKGDTQSCLDLIRVQVQIGRDLASVGYYQDSLAGADAISSAIETGKRLVQASDLSAEAARDLDSLLNRADFYFPYYFCDFEGSRLAYFSDLRRAAESNWYSALPVNPLHWRHGGCARLAIARAAALSVDVVRNVRFPDPPPTLIPEWKDGVMAALRARLDAMPADRRWRELELRAESDPIAAPISRGPLETRLGFMRIEARLALVQSAAKLRWGWNRGWDRHWPHDPFTGDWVDHEQAAGRGIVFSTWEDGLWSASPSDRSWNPKPQGGDLALEFPLETEE
ncbi:MAG: hypothetical protein AAB074_02985 [Planctomycetota bacterium]